MKKIMFNDKYGLTQAVLEGRKTMTRRVMVTQPSWVSGDGRVVQDCLPPKFRVGDVLAVAQSYKDVMEETGVDGSVYPLVAKPGYRNKMFVRADKMPHHIRIVDVRAERLQNISDEDCLREGIVEQCPGVQYGFSSNVGYCGQYPFSTPRGAFAALIDKVCSAGTWERNPYVYVYSFELIN